MISSTEPARPRLRVRGHGRTVQLDHAGRWLCDCAVFLRSGDKRRCSHVRDLPAAPAAMLTRVPEAPGR